MNPIKGSDGYAKVSSIDTDGHLESESQEPSPTILASSPTSPSSERATFQFAKAAFVFQDKLNDIRKKHTEVQVPKAATLAATPPPQTAPHGNTTKGDDSDSSKGTDASIATKQDDPVAARRLRILRLVQSVLTSLLSIAIAALQGKAYASYLRTKDTPGAWPTHPNLLPTILLVSVAVLAGALDLSLLFAYLFRSHAKTFFGIAKKSYNILTCVKGVSYVLASVVCKSGFSYGNSTGQNNDLWSWTCSAAADKFDSLTQAGANCDGQTAPGIFPSCRSA